VPDRDVLFGAGLGAWNGADAATAAQSVRLVTHRPAPVLARTITSLSTLSGGRILLGIGAGAIWDMIENLGVPRLDGGSAVRAMAEAITLIRALSGGGEPVTFDGEFYHVSGLDPADAPAPRVLTGSVGPKSLAVTGRLADGWIPPMASDWLSPL
jgi:alkanesulfonate monooxygenase SsuD/methylene tetrahydromethanopterin reductase-like flavin-dependent oxidoreductase (luciferase family)